MQIKFAFAHGLFVSLFLLEPDTVERNGTVCLGSRHSGPHANNANISINSLHERTKRNPAARRSDLSYGRSFRQPLRKKVAATGRTDLV